MTSYNYALIKTGEYQSDYVPQFSCRDKYLKGNKRTSLHLTLKYALICPWTLTRSFLESFSGNCSLLALGTDYVRGQMFQHILAPNGGYCLYAKVPVKSQISRRPISLSTKKPVPLYKYYNKWNSPFASIACDMSKPAKRRKIVQ